MAEVCVAGSHCLSKYQRDQEFHPTNLERDQRNHPKQSDYYPIAVSGRLSLAVFPA